MRVTRFNPLWVSGITQLKIQVYILYLTYFQQNYNVALIFFSQGTIQIMREELKKPDFSLLRLTKKLCHKGPLWQSVSIVQVDVYGEQAWSSGESTHLPPM